MISNSLDIDFIHGDIHDRSCKKYLFNWYNNINPYPEHKQRDEYVNAWKMSFRISEFWDLFIRVNAATHGQLQAHAHVFNNSDLGC